MLISSRIKLIFLLIFIPILVLTLWSLSNNNNDTNEELRFYYKKRDSILVETKPVAVVNTITPVKLPEVTVTIKSKTLTEQIKCMAHNIYHEAGGEPYMGQVAVARVVMNRVNHGFAASPCQVIYQTHKRVDPNSEKSVIRCQFSWVCQGKIVSNTDSDRYKTAEEIAELVIKEDKWKEDIPENILFFHSKSVNPRWNYRKTLEIGNHMFYAKN